MNATVGTSVTDLGGNIRYSNPISSVRFSIYSIETFLPSGGRRQTADLTTLLIGRTSGAVTTNASLETYHKHYFYTKVQADDVDVTDRVLLRVREYRVHEGKYYH